MPSTRRPHPYTVTFTGPKQIEPVTYVVMAVSMKAAVPKAIAFATADEDWGPKPKVEISRGFPNTYRGVPDAWERPFVDKRPADEPVGIPPRTPREDCPHKDEHDSDFIVGYVVTLGMLTLPMFTGGEDSWRTYYRDVAYVPGCSSLTHQTVDSLREQYHAVIHRSMAALERASGPTPMFTEAQPVYAGAHRH